MSAYNRSEVLISFFIFPSYDNSALQGLKFGTPLGAPQKRYIVYYTYLFKKFFVQIFKNIFIVGQFFGLFSAFSDTIPWVGYG